MPTGGRQVNAEQAIPLALDAIRGLPRFEDGGEMGGQGRKGIRGSTKWPIAGGMSYGHRVAKGPRSVWPEYPTGRHKHKAANRLVRLTHRRPSPDQPVDWLTLLARMGSLKY